MKLLPLFLSMCCAAAAAHAADNLPQDGYYRVSNHKSSRYVYVLDNHGSIDFGATSADLNAIELWSGHAATISDPATILRFRHVQDRQYDVHAQGTSIHKIIDYYMSMRAVSSLPSTYLLYATSSGMTKYLCDGERVLDNEQGKLSDNGEGEWRYWTLHPVAADTENYFGITPDIRCSDALYASFFAEFPFSFSSEGMEALYVSRVDAPNGIAVVETAAGVLPAETPLIVRCAAPDASGNRLDIGGTPSATLAGNLLKGVYFLSGKYKHENRLPNDRQTMRVPAALPDGTLGFVTCDDEYMPRNKAYLSVPADAPATLRAMTPAQYDQWSAEQAGIAGVEADSPLHAADTAIYTLTGLRVGDIREGTASLPSGFYICGGKKLFVR